MYPNYRSCRAAGRVLFAVLFLAFTVTMLRTPVTADPAGPLTITLNGSENYHVEYKLATYVEPGATVSGGTPPYSAITITGAVDNNVPGSYALTYAVTDANGQTANAMRTVTVADTIAPNVNAVTNNVKFTNPTCSIKNLELGASVSDVADGNPTVQAFLYSDEDDHEACLTGGDHAPDGAFGPPVPGRYRTEYARTLARYQIRNECRPDRIGRVYVALVVAYDEAGNMGYDTATVVVENPEGTGISAEGASEEVSQQSDEFFISALGGAVPEGFHRVGDPGP